MSHTTVLSTMRPGKSTVDKLQGFLNSVFKLRANCHNIIMFMTNKTDKILSHGKK